MSKKIKLPALTTWDDQITTRVGQQVKDIITDLAKKDDRTVSYVTRILINEALQARKLLKK